MIARAYSIDPAAPVRVFPAEVEDRLAGPTGDLAELQHDLLAELMAEPAGPLKVFPRGRPRSGLPVE